MDTVLAGGPEAATAPPTPGPVLERLVQSLPLIQERALEVDRREGFPREDVDLLRRIGALEAFAREKVTPIELMDALRLVGRASLSLGRIFEGHVNAAQLIWRYGDAAQRSILAHDLAEGRVFGVWNTQPPPGVDIVPGAGGLVLRGAKSFATGAGHIDRAVVTALASDGSRQMVIAAAADPLRTDASGWRTRGMKATLSGRYDLTGLPVNAITALGRGGDYIREPVFSAGAWRFTAVQLGGIERIVGLLRDHLATWPAGGDPVHRARFGGAVASMRTAWLWVREAALRAEAADAGGDAVSVVQMTRGIVEDAGLQVMETAARSVGSRAFFTESALDLVCRDLSFYLRQPLPDLARDKAAEAFIARDRWSGDRLW